MCLRGQLFHDHHGGNEVIGGNILFSHLGTFTSPFCFFRSTFLPYSTYYLRTLHIPCCGLGVSPFIVSCEGSIELGLVGARTLASPHAVSTSPHAVGTSPRAVTVSSTPYFKERSFPNLIAGPRTLRLGPLEAVDSLYSTYGITLLLTRGVQSNFSKLNILGFRKIRKHSITTLPFWA